jgi:hypothetical protein
MAFVWIIPDEMAVECQSKRGFMSLLPCINFETLNRLLASPRGETSTSFLVQDKGFI